MEHSLGTITVQAEIQSKPDTKIESLHDVTARYSDLAEKPKEHIYAVFLSNDNQLIGDKLLGLGSSQTATFDKRDLVRTAALVNASAVILVHNHPSGNSEPTQQDIQVTRNLDQLLDQLSVDLLDHVIISQNQDHSMRRSETGPFE